MENNIQIPGQTQFRIHPSTKPGLIHLTVANLTRQISFYQEVIGLQLHWQQGLNAGLGARRDDFLILTENKNAHRYKGTTGLYHFAVLLPDRRELGRVVARLYQLKVSNYPTDHIMTKTTYLEDPEGNQIEIYIESPEDGIMGMVDGNFEARRADGSLSDGREPLDVQGLFHELAPEDNLMAPMPPETRIGHFHLHVANLDQSMHFYHNVLGFDNMGLAKNFRMGMVSAGGYHHHIGFNTWMGEGASPQPEGSLGLRYFSFVLPDQEVLDSVVEHVNAEGISTGQMGKGVVIKDPSRNTIVLYPLSEAKEKLS